MLSLSPALPPTALRVPGSTAGGAPPGDFAGALAGLLAPTIEGAGPPSVPADRQRGAASGKDLPPVAASVDGDATVVVAGPAAVLPTQPDRSLSDVRASDEPMLPLPPRSAKGAGDRGADRDSAVDAPAGRATPEKRAPTRKDLIDAMPLPIPPHPGGSPFEPAPTGADARPAVAVASKGDTAVENAATKVRRGMTAPATSVDSDRARPVAPSIARASVADPHADLDIESRLPTTEAASHDDPAPATTRDQPASRPAVPAIAAVPVIVSVLDPAPVSAASAPPRPPRFVEPARSPTAAATLDAPIAADAPMTVSATRAPGVVPQSTDAGRAAPVAGRVLPSAVAAPTPPGAKVIESAAAAPAPASADNGNIVASVERTLRHSAAGSVKGAPSTPVAAALSATSQPASARATRTDERARAARPLPIAAEAAPIATRATTSVPATLPAPSARAGIAASDAAAPSSSSPSVATDRHVKQATTDPVAAPSASSARLAVNPSLAPAAPAVDPSRVAAPRAQMAAAVIGGAQVQPLAPRGRPTPVALRPSDARAPAADPADPSTALTSGPTPASVATPVEHVDAAHRTPLDMRRDDWTQQLIDRVERVRDMANASDTRIKLVPDALGKIDVSVRKDGDALHVTFTADVAQTRAMLADAQPRLAELAQQRGLRLGQASVDAGTANQNGQHHQPAAASVRLPSRPIAAPRDEGSEQTGRVA